MDLFGYPDPDEKPQRAGPPPEYGTPEWQQDYEAYIRTPQWKKLCREVRKRAKGRCENTPHGAYHPGPLDVHHLTYERFKCERLEDLKLLCGVCHEIADEKRKRETAARNAAAYEQAGEEARVAAHKESFFRTVFGDDWRFEYGADPEGCEERYADWMESKGDEWRD